MAGLQLLDAGEERSRQVVDVALLDVVTNCVEVGLESATRIGAKGFQLTREYEPASLGSVVERLDSEPVSRAEETLPSSIPQCERPHPIEPANAVVSPLAVRREHDLGVGRTPKPVPERLELGAKF